ncbi:MAG: hypothetical protein JO025_11300 [Verrucomicrobia bacterium]|nr:hypothetical protein [Verrucomicrobiota bacterium]
MKKISLVSIAFVLTGTLNLLAFVYVATHREYAPVTYSQDYLTGSNMPVQVPAWIGHMP